MNGKIGKSMTDMMKPCLLLSLLVSIGAMVHAQQISRVVARDFAEELEVTYTLKTDRPVTVQLLYSENDGNSWVGPLKSVSGDVGREVESGKNKIVWNFADEVQEMYGDRFRFKVRADEHYGFSLNLRGESFNIPGNLKADFGDDVGEAAYRLRRVDGWNGFEMKATSGNYFFEMHHELSASGVKSTVDLVGHRGRPAAVGMLFNAVLPGSGIPYVTFGECKNWTEEYSDRKAKKGNGNFWGLAIFGGAAVLLHNMETAAYDEELSRPFGSVTSAEEVALPYRYGKWGAGGLAGLIYTLQVVKVFKWGRLHGKDMTEFALEF
jgi:hypothetical protein